VNKLTIKNAQKASHESNALCMDTLPIDISLTMFTTKGTALDIGALVICNTDYLADSMVGGTNRSMML
jgi:hypothetical protein